MINIESVTYYGFEEAIRAMRNPMNSWGLSDTNADKYKSSGDINRCLGENDLGLMQRLSKAGVEHRTFARMINVYMDVTAPLYWWKEMDRYRIGKEQISTSTMHKIHAQEFSLDDFSHEHLDEPGTRILEVLIGVLNCERDIFNATKSKNYWWQMIQLLPSSYNQKRTLMLSYETILKIIRERKSHKLDEWRDFCEVLERLPYVSELLEEK